MMISDQFKIRMFPFVLVFIEIIVFLSMDMNLPALPRIAEDFQVSQDVTQYAQALWFLGSMSTQLFLGPVSEIYGRKNILLLGIVVFIVTNIVLAVTNDINLFLFARYFQGTTVCAVIITGYATIHELFKGKEAVQILAVMSSITILAPALGPVIGAVIITFYGWQVIFALLAALGILSIIAIFYVMPKSNRKVTASKNNISISSVLTDYKNIVTNKRFMQSAFLYFFVVINFFIWIVESPFIIINKYDKSELYFGIVQFFVFGGYILGAQTSKRLIDKLKAKHLSDFGLSVLGVAIISFLILSYWQFNIMLIIAAMVAVAFGASSLSGLMNRLAIESSECTMTSRVAIYSLIISMSASSGSAMVTLINDMTFDNIACLMLACYIIAVGIYTCLRNKVRLSV